MSREEITWSLPTLSESALQFANFYHWLGRCVPDLTFSFQLIVAVNYDNGRAALYCCHSLLSFNQVMKISCKLPLCLALFQKKTFLNNWWGEGGGAGREAKATRLLKLSIS